MAMNTRIFSALIALAAITSVVSVAFAQSPQPSVPSTTATTPVVSAPATAAASPGPAEMMKQMMEMAKLNENHKLLADLAGTWSYTVKMMAPGETASTSTGSVTRKPIMNGRFFVADFSGSMKMPGADGKMKDFTFKGTFTPAMQNIPMWQNLVTLGATQFTADPGGFFDIFIKVTTAVTTGGVLSAELYYVE